MAGLAGMMMAPSLLAYIGLDGTLNFTASTYQYGDGGEFNVVTTGLGSFATFCLETSEYINQPPSGPYTYTINTGAVPGDLGTDATDPNTGLTMDNISIGTAWLYSQFQADTLTLDTGTGSYFDANRLANAGELQQVIWYLEDETGGQDNGYVTLAETVLGYYRCPGQSGFKRSIRGGGPEPVQTGRQPGAESVGHGSRSPRLFPSHQPWRLSSWGLHWIGTATQVVLRENLVGCSLVSRRAGR